MKSYTDLTPGDLVVHEHHGIGRFIGMERMTVDGSERDFIKIAFAGTDFLYVPATSLDLISKYIGGGDNERVRLNKLGGADWSKAKARAKAAAKELAEGLIKLYAERAKVKGYAFPPDDAWQREFEEDFPLRKPMTSCAVLPRSRTICSPTGRWTACCAVMSALARPRSRCVP